MHSIEQHRKQNRMCSGGAFREVMINPLYKMKLYRPHYHDFKLDIWKESSGLNSFMDIMVPPHMTSVIEELFLREGIEYIITIPDVKKYAIFLTNNDSALILSV